MYYKIELDLNNFAAWQGGRDTLEEIIELGLVDELYQLIKDIFIDVVPTEMELNDFLWFDRDYIYESLGIE